MGEVTDKFRKVCNGLDGLPNYPVDWLPELFAIAEEMEQCVHLQKDGGLRCSKKDVQRYLFKFRAFQKKFLGLKDG